MAINDLTTIANVKDWIGQSSSQTNTQDRLIATEITRVSSMIMAWLDRKTFLKQSLTDVYSGTGSARMPLRIYPVLNVTAVTISNVAIPAGPANTASITVNALEGIYGGCFYFEPWDSVPPGRLQLLTIAGGKFWRGANNVTVAYTSGYVQTESLYPDVTNRITPSQPWGIVVRDEGVTYTTSGTALTAVTSNPTIGQYVAPNPMDPATPINYYQFSLSDATSEMTINYSYIPYVVEGACAELVAERLSYRGRIGTKSKALGGQETVSFQLVDLPDYIKTSLQPYRRVPTVGY